MSHPGHSVAERINDAPCRGFRKGMYMSNTSQKCQPQLGLLSLQSMCLWLYQDGGSAVVDCSVLFVRLVFQWKPLTSDAVEKIPYGRLLIENGESSATWRNGVKTMVSTA